MTELPLVSKGERTDVSNPWLALDVSTDPLEHARALSRAHERSHGADEDGSVRELVRASWRRSRAAGVTPDAPGSTRVMSDDELSAQREESPLASVVDTVFSSLEVLGGDARQIVAVSDEHARLLWVRGDDRAVERARAMHFEPGADWSESAAGTNAVGTAAALDHALQIFSAEHLVAAVHPWTCSAAPIHDPETGALIGVIDLTADLRAAHPHTLSLAMVAAAAVEAKLRERAADRDQRMRRSGRRSALRLWLLGNTARASFDGGVERGLRSLELLAVLAMHPEGMSAEQLALALYGEAGKTVTIRAQVHRVRAHLGESMVQTAPYRLIGRIEADWVRVSRLIAAGRPREALRAYRGPLLPTSDAPEIVEARMLLEDSLRRSILTTGDPALLSMWLEHPSGMDDIAAARALIAVLPAGDTRRAAATAATTAISRRLARG